MEGAGRKLRGTEAMRMRNEVRICTGLVACTCLLTFVLPLLLNTLPAYRALVAICSSSSTNPVGGF